MKVNRYKSNTGLGIMKTIGELMKELGFNPKASEYVQRAFIKHLVQVAYPNQLQVKEKGETNAAVDPIQLEFDFDSEKKVS
jgi:hypothetical protein